MISCIPQILQKRGPISDWTVISLGCGMAVAESNISFSHLTGVDIFPYKDAKVDRFIQHDVRKIREIIKDKSFDLVLCLDIIEHLTRREGFKLIRNAEAIARKAVVFYTPLKFDENIITDKGCWAYGNPYNLHKSLWKKEDFLSYEIWKVKGNSEEVGFIAVKWL